MRFFSTVRVALSVTATLLTEPDRDKSDFAVTVPTLPPDTEIAAAPFGLLDQHALSGRGILDADRVRTAADDDAAGDLNAVERYLCPRCPR